MLLVFYVRYNQNFECLVICIVITLAFSILILFMILCDYLKIDSNYGQHKQCLKFQPRFSCAEKLGNGRLSF
jgi:hypothetical protein